MQHPTVARPDAKITQLFPARPGTTRATYATQLVPLKEHERAHRFVLAFLNRYDGGTRDLYDRYLGRFLRWCQVNKLDPWAAGRVDLETYAQHLMDSGLGAGSARTALSPVRTVYGLAHDDGVIARNPARSMWLPKAQRNPDLPWIDYVELRTLIRVASTMSPRHHAVAILAGALGLRAGTIATLRVEDLDATGPEPVLRYTTKGGKRSSKRLVGNVYIAVLDAVNGRTEGPLIPKRNGEHMTRSGVTSLLKTICKHADIPPLSPHALRRSAITAQLDLGASIREAQNFADHARPETTMLYDRNGESLDQQAAQRSARLAG